jgi:hyperosmotically inducible protein
VILLHHQSQRQEATNMKSKLIKYLLIAGILFVFGGIQLAAQKDSDRVQEEIFSLANQVRKNLVMLTEYGPFDYLTFSIRPADMGYAVTLKGYASRPILKTAAESAVKRLEMVDLVENEIEVLPASPSDDDIRMEAYLKIYNNPSLARYNPNRGSPVYGSAWGWRRTAMIGISNDPPSGFHPISIIVKNGNLTLEGVVDTEFEKNIAGLAANQVRNVFSVTNNLVVRESERK